MPKVAVIIPAYNAATYIESCLKSVVTQSLTDIEVIVVDDGSTDTTASIVRSFLKDSRITLLPKTNSGCVDAINLGVKHTQCPYIARIDSDDLMEATRLEKQLQVLESSPKVMVVGSDVLLIDEQSKLIGKRTCPHKHKDILLALPFYNPIAHPSVMYRREAFLALGGLNNSMLDAEDYDLWARMLSQGEAVNLAEALTYYRIHRGAVKSIKTRSQLSATLRVKKHMRDVYGIHFPVMARMRLILEWIMLHFFPASWIYRLFLLRNLRSHREVKHA